MNELITVRNVKDNPVVSARELHRFLEISTDFNHWFKRMCEYGFIEGQDFWTFLTESSGGRRAQDAAISIEMAKEICMLQRNEKGKTARQYFIQLEKDWNSPEKVVSRALKLAESKIKFLERANPEMVAYNKLIETIAQFVESQAKTVPEAVAIIRLAKDY